MPRQAAPPFSRSSWPTLILHWVWIHSPQALDMCLAQALKILCSQIINNKFLSLPAMREGRGLAAPGSEEP